MHVAMVTPAYLPETSFGGPVFYIHNLTKILHELGHDVTVHTTHFGSATVNEVVDGTRVFRHPVLARAAGYRIAPMMYREILRQSPDVIHAHGTRSFQVDISALIALSSSTPLIINAHGSAGSYMYPKAFDRAVVRAAHIMHIPILKCVLHIAKRVVALSNFERNQFEMLGVPPGKIRTIPVIVDPDEFARPASDFRRKFGLKGKILLYVGRQSKIKGIEVLLVAYQQVKNKVAEPTSLVLMVPDRRMTSGESRRKRTGMHEQIIISNPSRTDIVSAFHASDIVILPSYYETLPTVILEAFCCGKPVIATNVGGIPELVRHGVNGFLVQVGDPADLSAALVAMLGNARMARNMGEKAKETFSRFSIGSIRQSIADLYQELA